MEIDLKTYKHILSCYEVRTRALEEIRAKCPETEASKIAGHALCMGHYSFEIIQMLLEVCEEEKNGST